MFAYGSRLVECGRDTLFRNLAISRAQFGHARHETIDDVAVAIIANERRCAILAHGEFT